MSQDKIAVTLQDVAKAKEKLKGIKKDMKVEELIINFVVDRVDKATLVKVYSIYR